MMRVILALVPLLMLSAICGTELWLQFYPRAERPVVEVTPPIALTNWAGGKP